MVEIRSVGLFFLMTWFVLTAFPVGAGSSQCIACHTDLKKLIPLCWEVEKIKPRLQSSGENSGEG